MIPWVISDSNYVRCPSQRLDPSKTVFVGALHGMLNAEALASIMNDLFGGVMYAGIDTDKHKYPIGNAPPTTRLQPKIPLGVCQYNFNCINLYGWSNMCKKCLMCLLSTSQNFHLKPHNS